MKVYAIVVAGGSGKRMGTELPKQFLEIAGKSILQHTLDAFLNFIPGIHIVVVLHPQYQAQFEAIRLKSLHPEQISVCDGGAERFHSVKNGLQSINESEDCLVAVHDAVRPFFSKQTLQDALKSAEENGNGIPVGIPSLRLGRAFRCYLFALNAQS
jgi:2-C-methyl-D-erythritol 4-phosphate cytidylyltransferase